VGQRSIGTGNSKLLNQYRVRWEDGWVDAKDAGALELIRRFEAAQQPKPNRQPLVKRSVGRGRGRGRPPKVRG